MRAALQPGGGAGAPPDHPPRRDGAPSGGLVEERGGDHLQDELAEEGNPVREDRAHPEGAQHAAHHRQVRGVPGRGEGAGQQAAQEASAVHGGRERAAAIPRHHRDVLPGLQRLHQPLLPALLQRVPDHPPGLLLAQGGGAGHPHHLHQRQGPRLHRLLARVRRRRCVQGPAGNGGMQSHRRQSSHGCKFSRLPGPGCTFLPSCRIRLCGLGCRPLLQHGGSARLQLQGSAPMLRCHLQGMIPTFSTTHNPFLPSLLSISPPLPFPCHCLLVMPLPTKAATMPYVQDL